MPRDIVGHGAGIELTSRKLQPLGQRFGLGEDRIGDGDGDFHTFGVTDWTQGNVEGLACLQCPSRGDTVCASARILHAAADGKLGHAAEHRDLLLSKCLELIWCLTVHQAIRGFEFDFFVGPRKRQITDDIFRHTNLKIRAYISFQMSSK